MEGLKKMFVSFVLPLLSFVGISAQTLPKLPKAQEITVGTFPVGAEYYFVKNPREAGFADFALVRQCPSDGSELRDGLKTLPHFVNGSPFDFLSRHGVGSRPFGYVTSDGGYETFYLSEVPVYDQMVCDSTLLLLFDMMSLSPVPQALFVSGDIDVPKIRERSAVLSLVASPLEPKTPAPERLWSDRDSARMVVLQNNTDNVASLRFIYSSARTSPDNLGTVIPVVTGMYAGEMGEIIKVRCRKAFRDAGVPVSDLRFSYKGSAEDAEDERFSISMAVPNGMIEEAMRTAGSVLGSMDRNGVTREELVMAKGKLLSEMMARPAGLTNSEYLKSCIASYKYGSDLASNSVKDEILTRGNLRVEEELGLFNDFVSALLDREKNLVIRLDVPDVKIDSAGVLKSFEAGWDSDFVDNSSGRRLALEASSRRIRLQNETNEPITGGSLWTFSNGIKVIYRHMDTPGRIRYAIYLNGGFPAIPETDAGESAFATDMFGLCRFAGMDGSEIGRIMDAHGITMEAEVTMSSFKISGTAPSDEVPELLKILTTMSSGTEIAEEDFRYYVLSESLRESARALRPREVNSISDSILCPGFWHMERKSLGRLSVDFPSKATRYFDKRLSGFNDGVFVLIGDLDAEAMKKELPRLLGGLPVTKGYSGHPKVNYPMISGRASWMKEASDGLVGGSELGVNICLSSRQQYDNDDMMTFRVAEMALRKELAGVLASCGYYAEVSWKMDNYPKETFTVHINCRPCRESGLPSGVERKDQLSVLAVIRDVLENLGDMAIDKNWLNACKSRIASDIEYGREDAEVLLDLIKARYCEGKDLVSGAKEALDAVTADKVRKMLSDFSSGAGVEYILL